MIAMFKAELLKLRRRRVAIAVGAERARVRRDRHGRSCSCRRPSAGDPGAAQRGATIAVARRRPAARPRRSRSARRSSGSSCSSCSSRTSRASSRRGRSARCSCASRAASALLAGKMAALLAFVAVVLLAAEILTVAASAIIAPTQDVSTSSWFSLDGLGQAAGDYATAFAGVVGVGVPRDGARDLRALDPGRAGHRDRLVGPVRAPARGRLDRARASGSRACCSSRSRPAARTRSRSARALMLVGIYVAAAVTAAALVFARRDVTA